MHILYYFLSRALTELDDSDQAHAWDKSISPPIKLNFLLNFLGADASYDAMIAYEEYFTANHRARRR
jgi:hypothetical protein